MANAQAGIFAMGSSSHVYLEFSLSKKDAGLCLIEAIASLEMPQATVTGSNLVIGIRPTLWRTLSPNDTPSVLFDFSESLTGPDGFKMPATQRDLFVWIASGSQGQVFDVAETVVKTVTPFAILNEEITGWHYRQNRDLIGFVDGTANPILSEAPNVALIPQGSPGACGSVLLFQRWRHSLPEFNELSVMEQETVIGRTKQDSEEFEEELLPPNSHVARTTLVENNDELPIFRRNTSYGSPSENGTVFVGFSKDQQRLHTMLQRMAGIPDGIRDALTYYSTPMSGSYYFVPSVEALGSFIGAAQDL